jgi:hypothetical protein
VRAWAITLNPAYQDVPFEPFSVCEEYSFE